MEKIKKYKLDVLIFIVEAICMILELCASRVLSPYFGSSQVVWTSVIAIILLSSSIGNFIGGKVADTDESEKKLGPVLTISALLTLIIPVISNSLIAAITNVFYDIRIGAILATFCLFLAPSIFLGTIPPIILKQKLKDLNNAGKTSGKLTAISTIGGIFGTILGGFVLVPFIGCTQIICVISVMLVALSFIPKRNTSVPLPVTIIIRIVIMILALNGVLYLTKTNNSMEQRLLDNELNIEMSFDTQYGRAIVKNSDSYYGPIRMMNIDSGYESAAFLDETKKHTPVYEYIKKYDIMFEIDPNIKNTMMIGGAGYSYPRHYISKYLDKNMDVVEIDGKITEIAKKYFYLNDLIEDYDLEKNKRLNLINEDGRTYVNRNIKKYDAILNDAFSGNTPAKVLTTLEAVQNIKNSLVDGGLYLTNIIGSQEGQRSRFLKAEVNTLKQVFDNVYVCPVYDELETDVIVLSPLQARNNIVIATDRKLDLKDVVTLDIAEDEIVLTDDYCPVDTLINI